MLTFSIMKYSTCMANVLFLAFCTCCKVNYSFCETVEITFEYMSFPCVGRATDFDGNTWISMLPVSLVPCNT